jgi:hypothetical protein
MEIERDETGKEANAGNEQGGLMFHMLDACVQFLSRHDVDDHFVLKTQIIGVMLVAFSVDYVAIVKRTVKS